MPGGVGLPAAARRQRPGLRRHQFPAWHPVATEEPAWLTRLASDAEVMLSRASAAARAMSAWVRVQQEARDGVVALDAGQEEPAPVPYYLPGQVPYDPQLAHWAHTMRSQQNRTWTLGYRLAAMPQAVSAADVPPAEQNKALEAWPRRRRRR